MPIAQLLGHSFKKSYRVQQIDEHPSNTMFTFFKVNNENLVQENQLTLSHWPSSQNSIINHLILESQKNGTKLRLFWNKYQQMFVKVCEGVYLAESYCLAIKNK